MKEKHRWTFSCVCPCFVHWLFFICFRKWKKRKVCKKQWSREFMTKKRNLRFAFVLCLFLCLRIQFLKEESFCTTVKNDTWFAKPNRTLETIITLCSDPILGVNGQVCNCSWVKMYGLASVTKFGEIMEKKFNFTRRFSSPPPKLKILLL